MADPPHRQCCAAFFPALAQEAPGRYIFAIMTTWILHPLNARHGLTPVMAEIRAAAREAVALAGTHADLPDFDLVVRAEPGGGVPKWGVGGRSLAAGLIEIMLDPARFDPQLLIRTLVHEFHHLIRWEGPGYGRSLGEALVSEGMAGHFVLQVLGGKPDPWDATVPASGVARMAMNEWARRDYDHARWFFGKGDLKNGTGYGLGHRIVAEHMAQNPGHDAVSLAWVPADAFRASLRQIVGADKEAAGDETGDDAAMSAQGKAAKEAEKAEKRETANGAGTDIEDGPPPSG